MIKFDCVAWAWNTVAHRWRFGCLVEWPGGGRMVMFWDDSDAGTVRA